jgi:hypothetical protein
MRSIARLSILVAGSLALAGSAMAADMTGAEIKEFISGKSVYLELGAGSVAAAGQGVIFYDPAGTALYKTGKGEMWHGTWKIEGNTACVVWKETPNNACTRYDKTGDVVSIINATTGQTRGKVTKTAAGNAEKLVP